MDIKLNLPPRYEVRKLEGQQHIDWAAAIVMHSNMFYSPIWPVLYPENKTARLYDGFKEAMYLVRHQIDSGLSLGVFDKEYQYKNPEAAAKGGHLYWDVNDTTADQDKLLEQMDFPLVSVALAYDGINKLDMKQMEGLIGVLPLFADLYRVLHTLDKRDPKSWEPTGPGEVLMRNATSTRHEYEGKGIMKALAQYMMHTAASRGYRGIQIEGGADAVIGVWSNPPSPYRGEVVSAIEMETYEEEDSNGDKVHTFQPAKQRAAKIYCSLKE